MLKNIIFDCSDTLLHFDLCKDFAEHFGDDIEEATRIKSTVFNCAAFKRYGIGTIGHNEAIEYALSIVDEKDRSRAEWLINERMLHYTKIDGMYELVKALKYNGYTLYILSDFPDYFEHLWENFDIFRLFDGRCVSYEAHASKSDGLLFEKLIERYNLDTSECVFVDDHHGNALMAETYGMKAITFTSAKDTVQKLRSFGVNI